MHGLVHLAHKWPELVARGQDLAVIRAFVDELRVQGGTLLLTGEPGCGPGPGGAQAIHRDLVRVRELVPAAGPGQTPVVLLTTDGQDLGTGLEQQIGRLPAGCVHLALVDPSGDCFGQEDAWRALPWASWNRLASLRDPRHVTRETGAIFARSLGPRLRDSTVV